MGNMSIRDRRVVLLHPSMMYALIDGRKCSITRTRRIAYAGDIFSVKGLQDVSFRINSVEDLSLQSVRDDHYLEEGFNSPGEFEEFWRSTHKGDFRGSRVYNFYRVVPVLIHSVSVQFEKQDNWEVDTRGD